MDENVRQPERRPIASREAKGSQFVAHWLVQRGASPNAISGAGMVCGLLAGAALATTASLHATSPLMERLAWFVAALGVQGRLLANMFDGMVAIETKQTSPAGELWNEVPDRVSDAAILIGAGYATGGHVILGYAAAGVAIFTAYVRAMGKVAGAHQEFCGPMAKQHRMFVITLVALFGAIAPAAWQPQGMTFGAQSLGAQPLGGAPALGLWLIVAGGLWTALRRLGRIAATLKRSAP